MNKLEIINLKQYSDIAIERIKIIILVIGFSYNACKKYNISDISLGLFNFCFFPDLEKNIKVNTEDYHKKYMDYIIKKTIDDLYDCLILFLMGCIKELRIKIPYKETSGNKEFLSGKYDKNFWKTLTNAEKVGIKLDSKITDFISNLGKIRNSLHYNDIIQEDLILKYKSFDFKAFGKQNGIEKEIDPALITSIDTHQYDQGSIKFQYVKQQIEKEKKYFKGDILNLNIIEWEEILFTAKEIIIPQINKNFIDYLNQLFPNKS